MVAKADRLRFDVDESALGLGKALALARDDVIHVGHPLIPECPLGTLDPDWIKEVAARRLIALGRDKHIRTRPAEVQQLAAGGLRVFRIGGKKDATTGMADLAGPPVGSGRGDHPHARRRTVVLRDPRAPHRRGGDPDAVAAAASK